MKFILFDKTFQAGETATLAMPLPILYSCAPMYLPIKIVNGSKPGPCLLLFGMVHGDEYNGIEIINNLIEKVDPKKLNGTIIAIPVLNIYGLINYLNKIQNGKSLEQSFPGDENGSFMERYAYNLTEQIIKKVDYSIQIRTGNVNHEILPQVYCNPEDEDSMRIARAFQAPVITGVNMNSSSIRKIHQALDIPFICYEAGEAIRFDNESINIGIEGIKNVMKKLNLLDEELEQTIKPILSEDAEWTISDTSGILRTEIELGTRVKKNQRIGHLTDPFGNADNVSLTSPIDGIILGINNNPLIKEGDKVFKVASFHDDKKAEAKLEDWEEIAKEIFNTDE